MKQHITIDQLNELSEKGTSRLIHWVEDHGYANGGWTKAGLLSIGQMIEFLGEKEAFDDDWQGSIILPCRFDEVDRLCDALWEVVKEVLEK